MSQLPDNGEEWVQASLNLPEITDPVAQAEILNAVRDRPGVHSVTVVGQSLHVVYNPVDITEHDLERLVLGSGHPAQGADIERDSPFA